MYSKLIRRTCLVFALAPALTAQAQSSLASLESSFQNPPDDARVMMRWWWFGPAVEKPELLRELQQMKQGGFGGYEIQPVYPLALDDAKLGFRNLPYLSPEFLDDVRFANEEGDKLGLRANLTLSSGWPYGGPHTSIVDAAGCIREVKMARAPNQTSVATPSLSNGETLLAVFAAPASASQHAQDFRLLDLPRNTTRMTLPPDVPANSVLRWYIASRTGQQVKRPAVDADGFVLDHFSAEAVQNHLHDVADKLIAAFGNRPPYSVFSDSLEVYGADWTPNLLEEFKKRRGYDLLPHLPELFAAHPDQQALSIRHDWGITLTELIEENYLKPLTAWAHEHHTQFRSQTYGSPAVSLSSNALVDLPEGEGPQWRQFSFTRWATSASHLYGRPVTSSETWTWLHSPAFRATPLDMKAEADRFFLQGINQLIGHGWAYSPVSAGEPGWRFYAAGVFNAHNPWWMVMPDVTSYLQRVSWILRQGEPANDVAIFLPEEDAWAAFTPGKVALTELMPRWVTPALTQAIEDAGYNFDYIDAQAIAARGIHYPILIMPDVDRISPETLEQIANYEQHGGKVIAIGRIPEHAPGFLHFEQQSSEVAHMADKLFHGTGDDAQVIPSPAQLGEALHSLRQADLQLMPAASVVGFIHRALPQADIYFLANTGNQTVHSVARFRSKFAAGTWLDPDSGKTSDATVRNGTLKLDLAPYESRILVFHNADVKSSGHSSQPLPASHEVEDLSQGWQVHFSGVGQSQKMEKLSSWTENTSTRYFSGIASYTRDFSLPLHGKSHPHILLNFGEGQPVQEPPATRDHPGMRAWYDPPIREAAIIYVNGQRTGSLWHPPYEIDLTEFVKPGPNHLEIRVANTAINEMAGQSLPDYRLLWARYGRRFAPQDMEHLEAVPSGLLGEVKLMERSSR